MVESCGHDFEKHRQRVIDRAVTGGVVCSLDGPLLRSFLTDMEIRLKPQQDLVIEMLDELRRRTEAVLATIEEKGSPYTFASIRALKSHHVAYVTFTKEGESFRAATRFARSLRHTIVSAWEPPSCPVNVRLRGSESQGAERGPLLDEVAKSLNVIWLLSSKSLRDSSCLMEVCAAVRQGTPVLPVRLEGPGIHPLNLPIWSQSPTGASGPIARDRDRGRTGAEEEGKWGHEKRQTRDYRHPEKFYTDLSQSLPKSTRGQLHRHRFLVRDAISAVRCCFESGGSDRERGGRGVDRWDTISCSTSGTRPAASTASSLQPTALTFHLSEVSSQEVMLEHLVGITRDSAGSARRQEGSAWNWQSLPQTEAKTGRVRGTEAVPWRSDEEISEFIRQEEAETEELVGMLIDRLTSNAGSGDCLWEGCKGLADLAMRDVEGLAAVRRKGGTQAILSALASCPKDVDVQRWGCQALIPLFADGVVAANNRDAGVEAVLRAFALLEDVEESLWKMGTQLNPGARRRRRPSAPAVDEKPSCDKWRRSIRKVEVQRVKEQRRASIEAQREMEETLVKEEAALVSSLSEGRRRMELEVEKELEGTTLEEDRETILAATGAEATNAPELPGLPSDVGPSGPPDGEESVGSLGSPRQQRHAKEGISRSPIHRGPGSDPSLKRQSAGGHRKGAEGRETQGGVARKSENKELHEGREGDVMVSNPSPSMARQRRRTMEADAPVHATERIEQTERIRYEKEREQWGMTEDDIITYEKAFVERGKDKDDHISLLEARPMFDKLRVSEKSRRAIWELCDTNRTGRLSRREWGVACHLARSIKTRGLELPTTLPTCLHLPGDEKAQPRGPGESYELQGIWQAETTSNETKRVAVEDVQGKGHHATPGGATRRRGSSFVVSSEKEEADEKERAYRISDEEKATYNKAFDKLTRRSKTTAKLLEREKAVRALANVGLDNNDLNHVWALADADRDGKLTRLEFGVAMHLAACTVRKKMQLPDVLPKCLAVNTDTESLNPALEAGGTRFSVSLKASGTGDWYGIAPESRERTATGETTGSGKEGRRADRSIRKSEADEDRTTVEDNLYAMSETERAQYDIIFMQVDADDSGKVDGREAAKLLSKSGLKREQLSALWDMADADRDGELDPGEWAIAMHLALCVAKKRLPLPKRLPRCLRGPGHRKDLSDESPSTSPRDRGKGSVRKRYSGTPKEEEEEDREGRKKNDAETADPSVMLRQDAAAFKAGKLTAAGFYATLARVFGNKRDTMVLKVALSLPSEKARALVDVAGLSQDMLRENEAIEVKLQQLRQQRVKQKARVKSTTSGATVRDVQLVACCLGNLLCFTLDEASESGATAAAPSSRSRATPVAVAIAIGGGVETVTRVLRMFDASDQEIMVEALELAITLARACDRGSSDSIDPLPPPSFREAIPRPDAQPYDGNGGQAADLRSLLGAFHTPTICLRVAEFAKLFPRSKAAQRLCCLLVAELGASCGTPARRCFAECCDPIVKAAGGDLDESVPSEGDGERSSILDSSSIGRSERVPFRSPQRLDGVREAACRAMAILAREEGLARRMTATGAAYAVVHAMEAAASKREVQLACLQTIEMITTINPAMWAAEAQCVPGKDHHLPESNAINLVGERVVASIRTFTRDTQIQKAACQAILALVASDASQDAARSVITSGGASVICRTLVASPNDGSVQEQAVLAIGALLDSSDDSYMEETTRTAGKVSETVSLMRSSFVQELVAAAGCELLCRSVRTFPGKRALRLSAIQAMASLCRGSGSEVCGRLVRANACEQVINMVEAAPYDVEMRRASLALVVGIAEQTCQVPRNYHDENKNDGKPSTGESASAGDTSIVADSLGTAGAATFVATSLREATAPLWTRWGVTFGDANSAELKRAADLLMASKGIALLCRHNSSNRDRLASLGACEALSRAVAIAGRYHRPGPATETASDNVSLTAENRITFMNTETKTWTGRAVEELAKGEANEDRCSALLRAGTLRAIFAAMSRDPTNRMLQKSGCTALACVADASKKNSDLVDLARNGGVQAVTLALEACSNDLQVARAGSLAVGKLATNADLRHLLGKRGLCQMMPRVLSSFAEDPEIAEEACRAVAGLATLSGFNRTTLGNHGAVEATAMALRKHPASFGIQKWAVTSTAWLVAGKDPSRNTSRILATDALQLVVRALARFSHDPTMQAEGLRVFAKVGSAGEEGISAAWKVQALAPIAGALALHKNDACVQHWGMATMRAMTGSQEECKKWAKVGAPETAVCALREFGRGGSGRHYRHDEAGVSRCSEGRSCTPKESLCVQFQACACVLNLAVTTDGRRRLVLEGAGQALALMIRTNPRDATAQRGALAALATLSATGEDNRARLRRHKTGVSTAIVEALETFPGDERVVCEGVLTIQNLSLSTDGAHAMSEAGVIPVLVRLLQQRVSTQQANANAEGTSSQGTESCGGIVAQNGDLEHDDRVATLTHLISAVANIAVADAELGGILGKDGACRAVSRAAGLFPRDLRLQACICRALRALAVCDSNLEDLVVYGGLNAILRAQSLFPRDREMQLAAFGMMESICRGPRRFNVSDLLAGADSMRILELAIQHFEDDPEVVAEGLRALVEMVDASVSARKGMEPTVDWDAMSINGAERGSAQEEGKGGEGTTRRRTCLPLLSAGVDGTPTKRIGSLGKTTSEEVPRAIGTVLVLMERNSPPRHEVSLSAFGALERLLALDVATSCCDPEVFTPDKAKDMTAVFTSTPPSFEPTKTAGTVHQGKQEDEKNADFSEEERRMIRWARISYVVRRTIKLNGREHTGLATAGSRILVSLVAARGRVLAQ